MATLDEYIKDFYNKTALSRNGTGLSGETLTLMYSLTVSVFAIGGLLGSVVVGMLVSRFGRKGTLVNTTVLVFIASTLMGFSRICGSPEMVIIGRFITGIHSEDRRGSSLTHFTMMAFLTSIKSNIILMMFKRTNKQPSP
ncbi:hypothetical protein NQZ68_034841 [Dissostichus eleginoides]|nr:hypothetical protein NQZ68_034841 [Dissostichus eleginoides]